MLKQKKNGSKKYVGWLGFLVLIPSLLLNVWQYTNSQKESTYLVKEVIDGDTFVTEVSGRVRMANIEAPELELCGGGEAKNFLEVLILNKRVKLDFYRRDVYNRPLVYVYVKNQMLNKAMLEKGLVEYYGRGGDEIVRKELKDVYRQALEDKAGIHGEECSPTKHKADAECMIKGNIGRDNNTEKVYHFPGCKGFDLVVVEKFRGEEWFCSEKEAEKAGFVKSKNCLGKKFK